MTLTWQPHAAKLNLALAAARPQRVGVVSSIVGLGLEVRGLNCAIGDLVTIGEHGEVDAEVVATTREGIRCMPLGRMTGIRVGAPVRSDGAPHFVPTGNGLFGRVIDGLGRPIDGKGPLAVASRVSIVIGTPYARATSELMPASPAQATRMSGSQARCQRTEPAPAPACRCHRSYRQYAV